MGQQDDPVRFARRRKGEVNRFDADPDLVLDERRLRADRPEWLGAMAGDRVRHDIQEDRRGRQRRETPSLAKARVEGTAELDVGALATGWRRAGRAADCRVVMVDRFEVEVRFDTGRRQLVIRTRERGLVLATRLTAGTNCLQADCPVCGKRARYLYTTTGADWWCSMCRGRTGGRLRRAVRIHDGVDRSLARAQDWPALALRQAQGPDSAVEVAMALELEGLAPRVLTLEPLPARRRARGEFVTPVKRKPS